MILTQQIVVRIHGGKRCLKHFGDALGCELKEVGSIPSLHPIADMMELADIVVLETTAARLIGSTPIIGTPLLVQRIEQEATNFQILVRFG